MQKQNFPKQEFYIKVNKEFVRISLSDINYIQAKGNYCKIFVSKQSHIAHLTMNDLLDNLPEEDFCRIHKSYIVNMRKVEKFSYSRMEICGSSLPIGTNYKASILKHVLVINDLTTLVYRDLGQKQ